MFVTVVFTNMHIHIWGPLWNGETLLRSYYCGESKAGRKHMDIDLGTWRTTLTVNLCHNSSDLRKNTTPGRNKCRSCLAQRELSPHCRQGWQSATISDWEIKENWQLPWRKNVGTYECLGIMMTQVAEHVVFFNITLPLPSFCPAEPLFSHP